MSQSSTEDIRTWSIHNVLIGLNCSSNLLLVTEHYHSVQQDILLQRRLFEGAKEEIKEERGRVGEDNGCTPKTLAWYTEIWTPSKMSKVVLCDRESSIKTSILSWIMTCYILCAVFMLTSYQYATNHHRPCAFDLPVYLSLKLEAITKDEAMEKQPPSSCCMTDP